MAADRKLMWGGEEIEIANGTTHRYISGPDNTGSLRIPRVARLTLKPLKYGRVYSLYQEPSSTADSEFLGRPTLIDPNGTLKPRNLREILVFVAEEWKWDIDREVIRVLDGITPSRRTKSRKGSSKSGQ